MNETRTMKSKRRERLEGESHVHIVKRKVRLTFNRKD